MIFVKKCAILNIDNYKKQLIFENPMPNTKTNIKRQECEIYSRVVGYLRPVNQWNNGKAAEYKDRKTFNVENK